VVGSYLHGPLLARNPALADLLLEWATGDGPLSPLDDEAERALRAERIAAARRSGADAARRVADAVGRLLRHRSP
jgi:CobQ-like glutamine amidotransferase family enzyme